MKTSHCTDGAGRHNSPRIAFFAGSFDPFTLGHEDIVRRALHLFDEIVVAVAVNPDKEGLLTIEQRVQWIQATFADTERVRVCAVSGLTVDAARRQRATCLLRGVRQVQDFEYEQTMAEVNRELAGIETVLLLASPQHGHISSSIVRQLHLLGHDVARLLPANAPLRLLP